MIATDRGGTARGHRGSVKISQRIFDAVTANPTAWFLLALTLLAEYWNYQRGMEVEILCSVVGSGPTPGPSDGALQRAQEICAAREQSEDDSDP
jgi:hypothetical protein